MKWLLFGALLGVVLVVCPATAGSALVAVAGQPLAVAFVLGVLARPVLGRRVGRWER